MDQVLRNRLLAQATLRETTGGKQEIVEAARVALKEKSMREQAQVLGDGEACGAQQRPEVVAVEKERKTPLVDVLKQQMKLGPIPVAEYMSTVLSHPKHGYYMRQRVFGEKGDFTTAPEISQIFGEMVGVWIMWAWQAAGSPAQVQLIELGPGRGTMMADILRTLSSVAHSRPLIHALSVHMVETSPSLQQVQRQTLSKDSLPQANPVKHDGTGVTIHWHDGLSEIPETEGVPSIIVGQEFLDCLPVRQFRFTDKGWCEKMVDIALPDNPLHFRYVLSPGPTAASKVCLMPQLVPNIPKDPEINTGAEVSPDACSYATEVGLRVMRTKGAALFIDYGHASQPIETMQAALKHAYHDPLSFPGECDVTAHVDFAAVALAILDGASPMRDLIQPPAGLASPEGPAGSAGSAGIAAPSGIAGTGAAGPAGHVAAPPGSGFSPEGLEGLRGPGAGGELPPGEASAMVLGGVGTGVTKASGPKGGLTIHGPISQTAFLHSLGVRDRVMALLSELPDEESADPQAAALTKQYERLCSPEAMGELFKVIAITPADSKFGCAGFPAPVR